ncbi:MAG TPA: urease accessory protein UreD [Xanthobacteraceae bacterium]|nr:urease accessory protein UreD [Xanthobacteraceae bacterium]
MTVTSVNAAETFASNRAHGLIELNVAVGDDGATRPLRVREEGSFRVRFPAHAGGAEAVLINTAGGIAGGDRFKTDVHVSANGRLAVTTAAAEKIYRSLGPSAHIDITLKLGEGAALSWLPQETILFDRARLDRTIHVDLAENARLLLVEALVFGRRAMGETLSECQLTDRWRVRRGGKLVYADGVRFERDLATTLRSAGSASGATAVATILMLPGNDDDVAAVRAHAPDFRGEVGTSAWNGMAAIRCVAPGGGTLRHDLALAITALGQPLPRLWLS